jgi:hypothetical protein
MWYESSDIPPRNTRLFLVHASVMAGIDFWMLARVLLTRPMLSVPKGAK